MKNAAKLAERFKIRKTARPLVDSIADLLLDTSRTSEASFAAPTGELTWDSGFSLSPEGWNPYVAAVHEYLDGCDTYESSSLFSFYRTFCPKTAAEYLCPALEKKSPLWGFDAVEHIGPWSMLSPGQAGNKRHARNRAEEKSWRSRVFRAEEPTGINKMGPVSVEKGRVEFQRLVALTDSIRTEGYRREKGSDVRVVALRHRRSMRYVITARYHRSAVLAALGYTTIPVILRPPAILDEEILRDAPAVRNGYWNREDVSRYLDFLVRENGTGRFDNSLPLFNEGKRYFKPRPRLSDS